MYSCIVYLFLGGTMHDVSSQLPETIPDLETSATENEEVFRRPISLDFENEDFEILDNDYSSDLIKVKTREPLLNEFLATILSLLNQKADWSMLQDAFDSAEFYEWQWDRYTEPFEFNSKTMNPDMTAFRLYKSCGSVEYMPVWVKGDGNCLYNSASMLMVGSDFLSLELRVSTTISMVRNRSQIEQNSQAKGLNLGPNSDYISDLKDAATHGCFQSTVNFIAMCWAIKSSAFLLYPNVHGLTNINALINHGLMAGDYFSYKGFSIMWSGSDTNENGWNHFVPLLLADSCEITNICNEIEQNEMIRDSITTKVQKESVDNFSNLNNQASTCSDQTSVSSNQDTQSITTSKICFANFGKPFKKPKMFLTLNGIENEKLPDLIPDGNKSNLTFFVALEL